jgi:hypothetical protein
MYEIIKEMESYRETLSSLIDDLLDKYLGDISNKYSIDKNELRGMWDGDDTKPKPKPNTDNLRNELNRKRKNELVDICNEMDINSKGNKGVLVDRIVKEKTKPNNVIKKIKSSLDSIIIKKNKWDNYEHTPTGFIFNPNTKVVIGKQEGDGGVVQLNKTDITICNQYKFKYNLPSNLGNEDDEEEDDDDVFNQTTDDDESDIDDEDES